MVPVMIQAPKTDAAKLETSKLDSERSRAAKILVPVSTPRDARLRKHADYQRVYKATRKQFSASMTWFLAARDGALEANPPLTSGSASTIGPVAGLAGGPRVGLTAGKVLGKAHERNRIKRRMREAVRHYLHELPDGIDLILHPRRSVMTMDFVKLEGEILRIFRQAATQASQPRRAGLTAITRPTV
jgi:ribonuclease P protein component